MISTATYQASIMGFIEHLSVTASEADQLLRKAVSVCVTARDNFWQDTANQTGQTWLRFCAFCRIVRIDPFSALVCTGSEKVGTYWAHRVHGGKCKNYRHLHCW